MSRIRSFVVHLIAFSILPVLVAAPGIHELSTRERPERLPPATPRLLSGASRPAFDPARPTVVVLLGADITEITDMLGPYEMFARAGGFNVVTVAPERRPTLLTGGLGVLPHHGLAEIDALLGGTPPAVVVVPNIPNVAHEANAPLRPWLRRQAEAGALMHSWCKGAMLLAHSGLLDGSTATAHWGDLPGLERDYPRVRWVRGVRWVEHGQFVISAGITSGIDATLRVLTRLSGEEVARRVARELRYGGYHFAIDPKAPQYELRLADLVVVANAAFASIRRPRIGLGLYDGVGELDVSNVYDAHAYTMAADVVGVSEGMEVVRTAHGVSLLPGIVLGRWPAEPRSRVGRLERFILPGRHARAQAASLVSAVSSRAPELEVEYLHADQPERFGLEPVLEDLARHADVATAELALRRMEYRSGTVQLRGETVPWASSGWLLILGGVGVVALRLHATVSDQLEPYPQRPAVQSSPGQQLVLVVQRPPAPMQQLPAEQLAMSPQHWRKLEHALPSGRQQRPSRHGKPSQHSASMVQSSETSVQVQCPEDPTRKQVIRPQQSASESQSPSISLQHISRSMSVVRQDAAGSQHSADELQSSCSSRHIAELHRPARQVSPASHIPPAQHASRSRPQLPASARPPASTAAVASTPVSAPAPASLGARPSGPTAASAPPASVRRAASMPPPAASTSPLPPVPSRPPHPATMSKTPSTTLGPILRA